MNRSSVANFMLHMRHKLDQAGLWGQWVIAQSRKLPMSRLTALSARIATSKLANMAARIPVCRRFKVPMRVQSCRSKLHVNFLQMPISCCICNMKLVKQVHGSDARFCNQGSFR